MELSDVGLDRMMGAIERIALGFHRWLDMRNAAACDHANERRRVVGQCRRPQRVGRRRSISEGPVLPQLSFHTPVGAVSLTEEDGHIVAADWGWGRDQDETPLLRRARDRLGDYFDGEKVSFDDIPLAPAGSVYRRRVWQTLCNIPFGQTRTYGDIARAAGGSARSVGGANGANPIPIIIPCHRVVAGNSLGGYSGGDGATTKRFLLSLEAQGAPLFAHPL